MEECLGVGDPDRSARLELAPQLEEERSDIGSAVESGLDPAQSAAVLPERARLPGAALCVPFGDQLDRAERLVALRGHVAIVHLHQATVIRRLP